MWWLLACASETPTVRPPDTHAWEAEGAVVVDGLEQVERLIKQGQIAEARILAERVYTQRWEPRLEPALAAMDGPMAATRMEYAFGQLAADIDPKSARRTQRAVDRIGPLEQDVRTLAGRAAKAFPTSQVPGAVPVPTGPEPAAVIVPAARPAWESGAAVKPVDGAPTEAEKDAESARAKGASARPAKR
jgi:hypothetical protein